MSTVLCPVCLSVYGPLDRLARRFCSMACKASAQATGRRRFRKPTIEARRAQGLLRYYIGRGVVRRPQRCEECGATGRRIEAAHFDYAEPLRVRWLCRSCHVRWDRREPKGGTVVVVATNADAEEKASTAVEAGESGG
jgi:hypothetical protein